jgi:hypothetical protein
MDIGPTAMASFYARFPNSGRLAAGDFLYSLTRAFRLTLQEDGNLVLYALDDLFAMGHQQVQPQDLNDENYFRLIEIFLLPPAYMRPVWASGTQGSGAISCNLQDDGNLVLYTDDRRPVWASNTQGNPGSGLICQDDGNLVILNSVGWVIWSSNTYAGPR